MLELYSRRKFLKHLGAGAATISAFALTGGCAGLLEAIQNRPVRRNMGNLSTSDPIIQTYREAVSAMRALPASDPRNWRQQAEIHLNFCPHGNWFFLPWHRAYLFYFEQICRELTGNDEFALPYWNWTENPRIPSMFWGASNSLNHPRGVTATDTAGNSMVGPATMERIMSQTNFFTFASGRLSAPRVPGSRPNYGELEGTPHNYIHGWIGRGGSDMGGFMSPLDPVFWTHHNMIDCCWASWNVDRRNPNPSDRQWANYTFNEFVDGQGNQASIEVVFTVLMPLLSYRFETSTKGQSDASLAVEDAESMQAFLRAGADIRFDAQERYEVQPGITVRVGEPVSLGLDVEPSLFEAVEEASQRVLLTVNEVRQPDQEDFFVHVFINRPEVAADTSFEDPGFAGSFAFFNDTEVQDLDAMRSDFLLDVTDTLRRLRQRGEFAESQLSVQLVAIPVRSNPEVREFSLERIELAIGTLRIEEGQERDDQ